MFVCSAGDEDDTVHSELEEERDGSLAGYLRHWSWYVLHFLTHLHNPAAETGFIPIISLCLFGLLSAS